MGLSASKLPKQLRALVHLPALESIGVRPSDVAKWPAAFRASVQTVAVSTCTTYWHGGMASTEPVVWTATDVASLARLFPSLLHLRVGCDELDRPMLDALLQLPTTLSSLYLVASHPIIPGDRTIYAGGARAPVPFANSKVWQVPHNPCSTVGAPQSEPHSAVVPASAPSPDPHAVCPAS